MFDHFEILIWPLVACVCMGLLHGYAGLHVLRRGVIFVDLSLAQMAALGAVVGMQFTTAHSHVTKPARAAAPAGTIAATPSADGDLDKAIAQAQPQSAADDGDDEHESPHGLLEFWPTAFALFGAIVLAFGRVPGERVPHEAIIGIVYVVATAASVLILSKSPHGHEQTEQMLSGKLLFVDRDEVLTTGALYAGLGLLHWVFRRQFISISADPDAAARSGLRVPLWDCLFYAIFALMVTRSVAVGGVLVVFSFLIIPGACAAMYVDGFRARVLITWLIATIVSIAGVVISDRADLPTGPTMVATFGVAMIVSVTAAALLRRRPHVTALAVERPMRADSRRNNPMPGDSAPPNSIRGD